MTDGSNYPVTIIADAMSRSTKAPGNISRAGALIKAIEESGADLPSVSQAAEIVRRLKTDVAALISLPSIASLQGYQHLKTAPEYGALLVFSDLSFCWFTLRGRMSQTAYVSGSEIAKYEDDLSFGEYSYVIALSVAHIHQYGTPKDNTFQEDRLESQMLHIEIFTYLEEAVNPWVDYRDMSPEQSWSQAEREDLEGLIQDIWLGLRTSFETETTISSCTKDEPAQVEVTAGSYDVTGHKDDVMEAFEKCLRALQDLDRFKGHEYIQNDLSGDRLSGYDIGALVAAYVNFDPSNPEVSNHVAVSAPARLRKMLMAAGKDAEWIDCVYALAKPPALST